MTEEQLPAKTVPRSMQEISPTEALTDEQLGNLLAAVGNHEAKALTLSLMEPGFSYTQRTAHKMLNNAQGENPGWPNINDRTVFNYFTFSFEPIGAVSRADIDPLSGQLAFEITSVGAREGVSLAGHLLDFSARHTDESLIDLMASTQGSGINRNDVEYEWEESSRAPINRVKIFRALIQYGEPIPLDDLIILTGLSRSVLANQLKDLHRAGYIVNPATSEGVRGLAYEVVDHEGEEKPTEYKSNKKAYPHLTQSVYGAIQGNPDISSQSIAEQLLKSDPTLKWSSDGLRGIVANILKHFADEGFLQQKVSKISVVDEKLFVLTEFLEIVDTFQNHDEDFILEGMNKANRIVNDPQQVSELMKKARSRSPHANARPIEETNQLVMSIVKLHPDGISNRQIVAELAAQGIELGQSHVTRVTRELAKSGLLNKQKTKPEASYTPLDFNGEAGSK